MPSRPHAGVPAAGNDSRSVVSIGSTPIAGSRNSNSPMELERQSRRRLIAQVGVRAPASARSGEANGEQAHFERAERGSTPRSGVLVSLIGDVAKWERRGLQNHYEPVRFRPSPQMIWMARETVNPAVPKTAKALRAVRVRIARHPPRACSSMEERSDCRSKGRGIGTRHARQTRRCSVRLRWLGRRVLSSSKRDRHSRRAR